MFTEEQNKLLSAPLVAQHVKTREQGGRQVSYVEGWHVIAEANRIFGFGSWSRETTETKCVSEKPREIGRDKVPGFGVTYIARVRVIVLAGGASISREGCGAGHGIDRDLGLAHESALKESETDAMKRALMTFGNPFGLALYDKEQANVVDKVAESTLRFFSECEVRIAKFTDIKSLQVWWQSEKNLKDIRDFGLDQGQLDKIKALVIARRDQLKPKTRSAA